MKYLSAVPAYGRDYKSKTEVQKDWDAGKDFLIQDMRESGYANKDTVELKGCTLNIRYKKLTMVHVIKVS